MRCKLGTLLIFINDISITSREVGVSIHVRAVEGNSIFECGGKKMGTKFMKDCVTRTQKLSAGRMSMDR